ncbi:MAG: lysine--tRNA ligase [Candidatus Paceibacterota bacterium]|jgi:lysyl-tRNA synthetase class 2
MASLEEIREHRLRKLSLLRERGVDPYPIVSNQDATLFDVTNDFSKLSKKKKISLVGRIMSLRGQGALYFFNFNDGTGTFQGMIKKDEIEESVFNLFVDTVDIGDFIEVTGSLFNTKTKQKTVLIKSWKMLTKSLRPLPEKWHGLQDVEERFRKRYLDALMSDEVKERFIIRSKIITEVRSILDEAGYLEVETPALQPLYGGASAEPFITKHNALDMQMYLRISDELYLKRMLVAGFPKVYEIARDFRNEGIDTTHNPEFTMVEFYESYSDAARQMAFVEKIIKTIVKKVFKKTKLSHNAQDIDFSKKFSVVSYFDLIKRYALIPNPESINHEELALVATQLGIKINPSDSIPKLFDNIYKKMCRPKLVQPTFIIDYPAEYLPLAKRNPKNPKFVDAFQLVAGGIELVKAFSELNDPIDQRDRFVEQEKTLKKGESDAQRMDDDFLEALEYGMPPAGGVGIGIDRLVMFLTDTHNIKEVIFFPTMKPKE